MENRSGDSKKQRGEGKYFRAFHTSLSFMTVTKIEDGTFLEVNNAYLDLTGYSREELIGKTASQLGILNIEKRNDVVDDYFSAGGVTGSVTEIKLKNGKTRSVIYTMEESVWDGTPCFVISGLDITEQIEADKILQKSEERLRLALSAGRIGLWDGDFLTGEMYWSPELYEIVGRMNKSEPITWDTFFNYIHPEDIPRVRMESEIWLQGNFEFNNEFRIVRENGEVRWLMSSGRAYYDSGGGVVRAIGVNLDVTGKKEKEVELERARKDAEDANQSKTSFMANISHEIRTPLSGIAGLADLLLKRLNKEENRHYVQLIKDSSWALGELVNDILDSSKIEYDGVSITERSFNIRNEFYKAVNLFQEKARLRGNRISWSVDKAVPLFLIGDERRLGQILRNLVSNAVKFTGNGSIDVEASCVHESSERVKVIILVRDNGPGIPHEKQKKIFNDYYQVDNRLTREHVGTGLGLSITKKIVSAMNGRIWVESKEGFGTTFFVEIGFDVPERQAETTADEEGEEISAWRELNILVAEDNAVNQIYIRKMIQDLGHKATIAENGQQALDLLGRENFDLVLMDIQMPVMDGYSAIRSIRGMESPLNKIPVYALTAYASSRDAAEAIEAGADGHMVKPLETSQLTAVINEAALFLKNAAEDMAGSSARENIYNQYEQKPDFYLNFCWKARNDIESRLIEFNDAWLNADLDGAAKICHSIAGLCAILNIEDGWRESLDLESKLVKSEDQKDPSIPNRLEAVACKIRDFLAGLETYLKGLL